MHPKTPVSTDFHFHEVDQILFLAAQNRKYQEPSSEQEPGDAQPALANDGQKYKYMIWHWLNSEEQLPP